MGIIGRSYLDGAQPLVRLRDQEVMVGPLPEILVWGYVLLVWVNILSISIFVGCSASD